MAEGVKSSFTIDFGILSNFGSQFGRDVSNYISALKVTGDKRRAHSLFNQLYKVFQIKQQTENQY